MAAEELAGAVADPYHVRRQVVVVGADRARERLLEVELHRLVRREDALVAAMGGVGGSENCKESLQRIAPNCAELRAHPLPRADCTSLATAWQSA